VEFRVSNGGCCDMDALCCVELTELRGEVDGFCCLAYGLVWSMEESRLSSGGCCDIDVLCCVELTELRGEVEGFCCLVEFVLGRVVCG